MDAVLPYIAALIPFLGGALMFYVIMKNILNSDRNERAARRRWEEEHGRSVAEDVADQTRENSDDVAERN